MTAETGTEIMQALAGGLDKVLNGDAKGADRKVGFTLLTFNFGEEGLVNYVSNADRADMVASLKSLLARWEGQPDVRGRA
jgi:hypothetical protein